MKKSFFVYLLITTLFFSCEEKDNSILGYWAAYSIEGERFENIVYFGNDGLTCFDVEANNRSQFHKIPNITELYCQDKLINYEIIDSKTIMLENIKTSIKFISNDEISISLRDNDFKLFRISKYQAISETN